MHNKIIRIGGASGYWGDSARATPQLLSAGNLDYIVYDYLAEITMSILARAKAKNEHLGYATDFITAALKPNIAEIARQGVKVISNAGGVNPQACAKAVREMVVEADLDLRVACVLGDNLLSEADSLANNDIDEMFTSETFPEPAKIQSINAYLGAFPVARALAMGADIVITGRSVDSAVTLGACIHEFGWGRDDVDRLAAGSLCGHILECGTQATGGNFTDWHLLEGQFETSGYPIAEVEANGEFICTKPEYTSGLVSVGTVSEQMLYEIGDPQAYCLPDVVCDFSEVVLNQEGDHRVRVSGALGYPAPDTYKVSATYADQFRGGTILTFYGSDADQKAEAFGNACIRSAQTAFGAMDLADFSETSIELIGAESQYGQCKRIDGSREVSMKIAVKHESLMGVGIFLKELAGLGLAGPPGLSGFAGARAKPSPVVRLFSFLMNKSAVRISIDCDGEIISCDDTPGQLFRGHTLQRATWPEPSEKATSEVLLSQLAWGRSGDKGDKANIGIIARKESYLPYICAALTIDAIKQRFAHFLEEPDNNASIDRYLLPGSNSVNILLHRVLGGGGVASIRNDAQGKGYAQLLLELPVLVPEQISNTL
ncbi:MAG: acyclic terpene utilization AtuA family protein [Pseudomonadota bacterium]